MAENAPPSPTPTQPTTADQQENAGNNDPRDPTMNCGTTQLKTGFVWAPLLPQSKESSSPQDRKPSPPTAPASQPPPEGIPPSTQPKQPSFVPTPPSSQPSPSDSEASQIQALSRQSTASTLTTTTSISSFSSDVAGDGDDSHNKLCRILSVVQDIVDRCRICWVNREVSHPHATFRCTTRICSGDNWKTFKSDLQFPRGVVCYFCLAPYGPPFDHPRAPPGTRQSPEFCDYPDVLKELAYIVYQDRSLREKVFGKLGGSAPSTLYQYKRYITKPRNGGILGTYDVINAYLDVREEEGSLA
jgi:hypothetical protein